ncbi:unnamed protein product [Pleuronectes platessa]|uniref:Uncharacterized protein n=1 Tax=Pleuronectes platessa TaxID=8262 RepID=A0A9N7ZA52_PLEPL|nr:unnamed protein product [Pleuronectes platessa]
MMGAWGLPGPQAEAIFEASGSRELIAAQLARLTIGNSQQTVTELSARSLLVPRARCTIDHLENTAGPVQTRHKSKAPVVLTGTTGDFLQLAYYPWTESFLPFGDFEMSFSFRSFRFSSCPCWAAVSRVSYSGASVAASTPSSRFTPSFCRRGLPAVGFGPE